MKNTLTWLGVLVFASFLNPLLGQDLTKERPTVTRTYAIKGATIIPKPGEQLTSGTVIVRNGLIEAVGKDLKIPGDAKVLEVDSMFVYPGFIDGLSNVGVPKKQNPEGNSRSEEIKDPGNPPNDKAGITPETKVRDHLDPNDPVLGDFRELGFTIAHAVPRGLMLPGSGALVLLSGDQPDAMVLREATAMFAQFTPARRMYPGTIIGVMAKLRDLYRQAEGSLTHREAYADQPVGMSRPVGNRVLEAFYPVIQEEMPVFMVTKSIKDVHRALNLQKELGFSLVLADLKQGWLAVDLIKANQLPVFLSLDLPEVKEEKKKKEGAEKETSEEKETLEARRAEQMKKYESQAAVLQEESINFGFSTINTKANDVRPNLRRQIKAGLSEVDALAALTTNPAKMLGLSEVAGTVEKGKIANLVITDAPYFTKEANVRFVMVDGHLYEYEVKEKKKSDPDAKVDVAGKWSYSIDLAELGIDEMTGVINLSVSDGNISGTVSYSLGDQLQKVRDASVEGNELKFSTDFADESGTITADFRLVIDGDSFSGTTETPVYGTFEIEGNRKPN